MRNPSAGLFPFTLLIFLCWSLGCGEYRLLPLTVLVASFVAQCQLAFLPPSLGVLVIGMAGLGVSLRSARIGLGAGAAAARPRGVWRWALAALLVAVVCWTPPAIDQIEGKPGNLTAVVRTVKANTSTLGVAVGWHAVVLAVGIPPWWLRNPASAFERKNEVRVAPNPLATASTVLALCALLIVAAVGVIRRRSELWIGASSAVALCAGLAVVAASTPTTRLLSATLGYTLWSGSSVGMFVWVVLAWAPAAILAGRVPLLPRRVSLALASAVGIGAVAGAAVAVAVSERQDEHLREYHPLGVMLARLDRGIPSARTVKLVGSLGSATFRIKMAARFAMVRHGIRPISPGTDTRVGSWYELDHHRYDCTVYIEDGTTRPASPSALIASVIYGGSYRVSAWVAPAGCPPGHSKGPVSSAAALDATRPSYPTTQASYPTTQASYPTTQASYPTTWVSYQKLLEQVRSGPLIRAIINPARGDAEIKFRDLLERHAFYPAGAQPTLLRLLHARHVRVLFVPRRSATPSKPATVHHHLRYIAAGVIGALAVFGLVLFLYRRRHERAAAVP